MAAAASAAAFFFAFLFLFFFGAIGRRTAELRRGEALADTQHAGQNANDESAGAAGKPKSNTRHRGTRGTPQREANRKVSISADEKKAKSYGDEHTGL